MQPNTYPDKAFFDSIVDYYCKGDFVIHAMLISIVIFAIVGLYLFFCRNRKTFGTKSTISISGKSQKNRHKKLLLNKKSLLSKQPLPSESVTIQESKSEQEITLSPSIDLQSVPQLSIKPIQENSIYQMIEPQHIETNVVICLVGRIQNGEDDNAARIRLVTTAIKAINKNNIKAKVKALVVPPSEEMNASK